jgi:hypothetical protein
MTEQTYNALQQHREAIDRFIQVGQEVSTAPRQALQSAWLEIYGELKPMSCSSCIREAYERIHEHILEYERNKKG